MLKQGFCTLFLKQLQSLHCVLHGKAEMTYNINWTESSYNSYSSRNHETPSVLRLADFCWLCTFAPSSAEVAELWWIWLKGGGQILKGCVRLPFECGPGAGGGVSRTIKGRRVGPPWHFLWHSLFPLFHCKQKTAFPHLSAFSPPPLLFFVVCADCDELYDIVGG